MPPKKKAKKTQTVSLDKRTQAKLLRDKASAFEAEATVEERIHELLEELEEGKKVAEKFFDIVKSKGVRKAYASLPKDAEITLDTDGVLRVNDYFGEVFHARGCPFELTLNGKTWVVDGTMDYGGSRDWCGEFEGTVTHKKEVHEISYTSGRDCDDKCYSGTGYLDEEEEDEIREALDGVFGNYKWNYHE